ncbi:GNAT family N-acetyltransferase [Companilactobacillus heilongjiangensis]|uniref:Acetyltransferase n=1 Tax=Companilactobacillus heilongjiangensis TaxID=1074467 RepID=A0A0K2LB17_9LACO|nr:GNAT family N-acetyltransferase [Companilactobacillus heilongjiangensis]ALB28460.1 acetyltransferase [Companilactobacillus heilongjiangensis]
MIRKMRPTEVDVVGDIWLNGNLEAHDFIDKDYWINHLDEVKEQFKQADIYVYDSQGIQGFAGLTDNYIAGIFVKKEARNQGVGKQLLDYLKQRYDKLTLDVYAKNKSAFKFYQNNDFRISVESIDEDSNEKDYQMVWSKG